MSDPRAFPRLARTGHDPRIAVLARALSLTPAAAQLVLRLLDGGLSWVQLDDVLSLPPVSHRSHEPRGAAVVAVHVCNIRAALGDGFVLGFPGRGWTLSGEGTERVRRALREASDEVAS
jgi:hypothetical protein